jgi:YbbR domain-containing protein
MNVFTRNLLWKLFALAAAFAVWLNVSNEPDLATIVSVPVQYNHFPKDLEISSDIEETVDLEAKGSSGLLRSLHDGRIAAIIDFADVSVPGERTFTITDKELKLPRGLELVRTIPAQLRFRFERRATRFVPVDVRLSGKLPAGFAVAGLDVMPPQLQITGPESHVLGSDKLESDPLDLSGVTGDKTQTLAVYASDTEVRILNAPQVRVKIRVGQHVR